MAKKLLNWLAALPLAWCGLACSALIEVELPRVGANATGLSELRAILPADGTSMDALHIPRAAPEDAVPRAVVLRAAQSGAVAQANASDIRHDFPVRAEPLIAGGYAAKNDSFQTPELWTLIFVGAGLVAYQLRRQVRSSRGAIKFPS
jgi:hypothetical protein